MKTITRDWAVCRAVFMFVAAICIEIGYFEAAAAPVLY